ncbi:hypothetical protein L1987_13617 [Smallanthus sonchifolius]|uniref:Uncharacterized protein n=1 Tax=Smallanthus sonchifolius TaxID=185202 RepID=A0ACB9JJC6_9ASTR|nr:hypothetical protein L1987_13617 [Smallanthus sonchifolius]
MCQFLQVNGTSTLGVLLELLQVLTDFDLKVTKSSGTKDGSWFMDVFYVIDHEGNIVTDEIKIQNIQKAFRNDRPEIQSIMVTEYDNGREQCCPSGRTKFWEL